MNNFINLAKREFENSDKEIFPFIFEEKQYWLKKARATKPNNIQKIFYKFFPFELLIPSLYKTPKEALEFESSKLKEFKTLGINVPNIVYKCEDFFVLEDSGETIDAFFRYKNINENEFYIILDKLILELSKIHNLNQFHGGSQIRNFTYKEERIYVLDFEESYYENIDIKSLQYRDFLLFILSFIKIKESRIKVNFYYIIEKYLEFTDNKDFIIRLNKFAKKISFIIWFANRKFIKKLLGSDLIYFLDLFEILNNLKINTK
ncbi:hypothetical protein [Aliarcobacter lanthieri]|uniref:hypothetical protein n=1 Tax=Aliarcobacter lanthieri TaxID=1355374 RepID=UPI00047E1E3D|nr:hypothetical protein [Aliarcobacter lanthieri]QKF59863.1 hypothetical protein ALANTH_1770 [Aliarcobacter lanthieri]